MIKGKNLHKQIIIKFYSITSFKLKEQLFNDIR